MDPSPLTRGKLTLTHSLPLPHWLIPAHAGKTLCPVRHPRRHPAHPRSRGENGSCTSTTMSGGGSSPLTRGKRWLSYQSSCQFRLIPAHAGKTPFDLSEGASLPAHPRSRGENGDAGGWLAWGAGSSPLTRGKLVAVDSDVSGVGLIPAHAGKTTGPTMTCAQGPAHPRSRGENFTLVQALDVDVGSSPLTRGKP